MYSLPSTMKLTSCHRQCSSTNCFDATPLFARLAQGEGRRRFSHEMMPFVARRRQLLSTRHRQLAGERVDVED